MRLPPIQIFRAEFKVLPHLGVKNLDVWCRVKFEGPDFKKKGSRSRMLVDSISLIELD